MSDNPEKQELLLRVAEAPPKDVGRGLVRLDPQDLDRLGVGIGDVVEITGKRPTVARAMPAYAAQREDREPGLGAHVEVGRSVNQERWRQ